MLLPGGSGQTEISHGLKVNLGCQTVTKCCREGAMAPKGLSPIREGHTAKRVRRWVISGFFPFLSRWQL